MATNVKNMNVAKAVTLGVTGRELDRLIEWYSHAQDTMQPVYRALSRIGRVDVGHDLPAFSFHTHIDFAGNALWYRDRHLHAAGFVRPNPSPFRSTVGVMESNSGRLRTGWPTGLREARFAQLESSPSRIARRRRRPRLFDTAQVSVVGEVVKQSP